MKNFGTRELCKYLECLGFTLEKNQTSSHHLKYKVPKERIIPKGLRPFMIVQIGQKTFPPHSCSRYISEIKYLGFTKKEIEQCM